MEIVQPGGSGELIVGVTEISGGTNGLFLYDNNGVLGEIAGLTKSQADTYYYPAASVGNPANYTTLAAVAGAGYLTSISGKDHSTLANLSYASSGHTGFQSAITTGTTAQYLRGDLSLATLNQAAVAGLTTADSPTFANITVGGIYPVTGSPTSNINLYNSDGGFVTIAPWTTSWGATQLGNIITDSTIKLFVSTSYHGTQTPPYGLWFYDGQNIAKMNSWITQTGNPAAMRQTLDYTGIGFGLNLGATNAGSDFPTDYFQVARPQGSLIGTATFTNGSTAVTGTGSNFTQWFKAGDYITWSGSGTSHGNHIYGVILTVNSDTSITLNAGFAGTGGTGVYFSAFKDFGLTVKGNGQVYIGDGIVDIQGGLTGANLYLGASYTGYKGTGILKFSPYNVLLVTPEAGVLENNGADSSQNFLDNTLYYTPATVRNKVIVGWNGSGTLTAGTTTTVTDARATTTSKIFLQAKTASFTTIGAYISAKNNGSFVITTLTALGTETFDYLITQ